jgi:hypothetical protein
LALPRGRAHDRQPSTAQLVDKIGRAQAAQQQVGRPRQATGSRYRRAERFHNLLVGHWEGGFREQNALYHGNEHIENKGNVESEKAPGSNLPDQHSKLPPNTC